MYKDINDYELLYLIKEKDEIAYNDIYAKYSNMVKIEANKKYKSYKYIGISWDDIYEAGLYGLNLAIENYDEKEGPLFYTCANVFIINEINSLIRSHDRKKHNILSDCISLDKEIDTDGNNIGDFIENKENNIEQLYENINILNIIDFKYDLPFLHSLVYELRINNFNNREIAKLLDVDYKSVDNALMSIKNKFKKTLNKIEEK